MIAWYFSESSKSLVYDIHAVLVLAGIVPLTDTLADILLIVFDRCLIQGRLRLEYSRLPYTLPSSAVCVIFAQTDSDSPVVRQALVTVPILNTNIIIKNK